MHAKSKKNPMKTEKRQNKETKRMHTTPLNLFTSRSPRPWTSKCHALQHVLNMHFKSLTISTHTPTHCLVLRPHPMNAIHLHHHHKPLYLFILSSIQHTSICMQSMSIRVIKSPRTTNYKYPSSLHVFIIHQVLYYNSAYIH